MIRFGIVAIVGALVPFTVPTWVRLARFDT